MSNNLFNNPFMLGFDELEDILLSISKGADTFPPYNIEQLDMTHLRISLAVAGYREADLDVSLEDNQLVVRGKQENNTDRHFLHRGIAGRAFIKSFILAQGIEIIGAFMENGLLHIDLEKPEKIKNIKRIAIKNTQEIATHSLLKKS